MNIRQLRAAVLRLRGVVWSRRLDRDLAAEIESHLQLHVDDNLRAGMTPEEARRQALLALGGVEVTKERLRDRRGLPAIDTLAQDIRLAVRSLRRAPGFTAAVVVMLGVGIAATTVTFSGVNAGILGSTPGVTAEDELVRVSLWRPAPGGGSFLGTTFDDFLALQEGLSGLTGVSANHEVTFTVSIEGQPLTLRGALVSGNYFDVLGTRFTHGRGFTPDEDRAPWTHPVAVIGHAVWQQYFGGDPSAVGREILVNGAAMQVVGVAPPGFRGVRPGSYDNALWVPLAMAELALRDADGRPVAVRAAGARWFDYVGRLAPGVTVEQARARASAVAAGLAAGDPSRHDLAAGVRPLELTPLSPQALAIRAVATMAVPMIVLAIACINAANLLLARATRRGREWALRIALGAPASRVVRYLVVESLLLATAAAGLGLLLTMPALSMLSRLLPPWVLLVLDTRVALFAIATGLATAAVFGLGPALRIAAQASATGPTAARLSGHAPSHLKLALVTVQVALALALLATAGQFINTFRASMAGSGIPDPDRVLEAAFDLDHLDVPQPAGDDFYRRLLDRVRVHPAVAAAAITNGLTLSRVGLSSGQISFRLWPVDEAPPDGSPTAAIHVEGNLFDVLGLDLLQGRSDTAQGVIVNQALADRFFEGQAVGRTFEIARFDRLEARRAVTVTDMVASGPSRLAQPTIFLPSPVAYDRARTLHLRIRPGTAFDAAALQDVVRQVDPHVPIASLSTARALLSPFTPLQRQGALATVSGLTTLGVLALPLSAAGLFSVLSFIVSTRSREIGVRTVLGADPSSVVRMVARQSALPVALGIVLGAAGAAAAGVIVRSALHGASPVDPLAFAGVSAVLVLTMLGASVIPARRATRVDPMVVLRDE